MSLLDAGHAKAMEAIKEMAPVTPDAPGATPTEATPEGTQQGEGATQQDSFSKLDPNALPPELRPYYESMQGDYTRKTQEAAPYRRLAEETGLDADGLRQAAELYATLQDPQSLVQFHSELTAALVAEGLTPAEAHAAATEHVTGAATNQPEYVDPEEQRIAAMEARLAQFEQDAKAREQASQEQMRNAAFVAEMNRQESVIREQYPHLSQMDIDAVYEMSHFYGGNLLDAAARYDEVVGARLAQILNGKGAVQANPAHAPLPSAAPGVTRPQKFDSVDEAHRFVMKQVLPGIGSS